MRNNLVLIFGLAFLVSCSTSPKPQTYRQQLDIYKDMKIRLYQVARPIKTVSASACPKTSYDDGILTHHLSDYPEYLWETAQSYWGLREDAAVLYKKPSGTISNCFAPVVLDYGEMPNAHTDGDSIFVTPALLNAVDDLSLSLIIAHELAHIARGHMDEEPSEQLEREADRFALFMLARAGLDYKKAAMQDAASRRPHTDKYEADADTNKRVAYFGKVVAEIDKLKTEGEALIP